MYLKPSEGRQEWGLHGASGCKTKICPEPEGVLNYRVLTWDKGNKPHAYQLCKILCTYISRESAPAPWGLPLVVGLSSSLALGLLGFISARFLSTAHTTEGTIQPWLTPGRQESLHPGPPGPGPAGPRLGATLAVRRSWAGGPMPQCAKHGPGWLQVVAFSHQNCG